MLAANLAERQAKQDAEQREAETKAVLGFVENRIFAAARPEGQAGGLGHDVTLRRAIEAALLFVDQSFPKQPLIEARLRLTLAVTFGNLGDLERQLIWPSGPAGSIARNSVPSTQTRWRARSAWPTATIALAGMPMR